MLKILSPYKKNKPQNAYYLCSCYFFRHEITVNSSTVGNNEAWKIIPIHKVVIKAIHTKIRHITRCIFHSSLFVILDNRLFPLIHIIFQKAERVFGVNCKKSGCRVPPAHRRFTMLAAVTKRRWIASRVWIE